MTEMISWKETEKRVIPKETKKSSFPHRRLAAWNKLGDETVRANTLRIFKQNFDIDGSGGRTVRIVRLSQLATPKREVSLAFSSASWRDLNKCFNVRNPSLRTEDITASMKINVLRCLRLFFLAPAPPHNW
ncbi:hypothetical protein E2C01_024033 [Portunus trituberculatus]|uniref:Uncharacterized protein n=1 Tax=Portunus trituberculatus TaxID=210409 RepID=A0A5B7EDB6_PORTR|nr:hypothetical protein [Portunus trituberculatus]